MWQFRQSQPRVSYSSRPHSPLAASKLCSTDLVPFLGNPDSSRLRTASGSPRASETWRCNSAKTSSPSQRPCPRNFWRERTTPPSIASAMFSALRRALPLRPWRPVPHRGEGRSGGVSVSVSVPVPDRHRGGGEPAVPLAAGQVGDAPGAGGKAGGAEPAGAHRQGLHGRRRRLGDVDALGDGAGLLEGELRLGVAVGAGGSENQDPWGSHAELGETRNRARPDGAGRSSSF